MSDFDMNGMDLLRRIANTLDRIEGHLRPTSTVGVPSPSDFAEMFESLKAERDALLEEHKAVEAHLKSHHHGGYNSHTVLSSIHDVAESELCGSE